jgi:hypothetical protein
MEITETQAREMLNAPRGSRPRIYAEIAGGVYVGQTVAIRSLQNLDSHAGNIGALRVSFASVMDFVNGGGK